MKVDGEERQQELKKKRNMIQVSLTQKRASFCNAGFLEVAFSPLLSSSPFQPKSHSPPALLLASSQKHSEHIFFRKADVVREV